MQSSDKVWALSFANPDVLLSMIMRRFPACLVNQAVFLEKPDTTLSGRSRGQGTIDQVPL